MRAPALFRLIGCCLLLLTVAACREEGGVEVRSFTFDGVDAISEGQLRTVLATGAGSRLPFGTKRYFNRQQFEADLKRIVAFYRDRGFPDARVTDFNVQLSEDQNSVRINITIDEGEPIVAERIVFEGFEVLPEDHMGALERELPLRPEAPLDRALLQASRETALDELRDHGHPYASVRIADGPGSSPRHRVIVLHAEPGPHTVHGPVQIVGNTSVDERVIRRQLTFRPGMEFRQSRLQESQRMLYSQELFQFANVEPIRGEGQPVEIPTRVTVTEGDHRRLTLRGGYGTEENIRGEIDWRHVNFFGGARTAGVRARYSGLDQGVRLSFTEPYFFSPRWSLGLSGQSWFTSEPLYWMNSHGGSATITRQFARRGGPVFRTRPRMSLSLTYGIEFEHYEIEEEALVNPIYRDELIARGLDPRGFGRGTRSFIAADWGRNTTDNIIDARRGYVTSVHLERAATWLGGDINYYEATVEGRFYQNLADRAVLAVQARTGSIQGLGDHHQNVPAHKRYFLGGSGSLRGWGRFQVSPLTVEGHPLGGATFFNSSVEIRTPVWGNLSGVVFLDAGNVWEDPFRFDFSDLRYNVGPGIRYNTPIGPIRADIGYQLNPIPGLIVGGQPETRRFRFHFSIGQAF